MSSLFLSHKEKLLRIKSDLLTQMYSLKNEFNLIDKAKGDESDLSVAHQEEHTFLITQNRLKFQLLEVEHALSRIENGTFGICELTFEPIEVSRLEAIPWTRFSIEGAEISEEIIKNARRKSA